MSKNNIIIALVVLCLVGTIWGSVQDKKSEGLERQLAAMKEQSPTAVAVQPAVENDSAALDAAHAEVEKLKAKNKNLQKDVKVLKGSVSSQQHELTDMKKTLVECDGSSQDFEAMRAELEKRSADVVKLNISVDAVKITLEEKVAELAAASQAIAGFENMKSSLANSVDVYSAKSQELAAKLNDAAVRVDSLENALEERTKLLVARGSELSRSRLNMNVLLSKIAEQNSSLAILEETRVALEQELARKFLTIEELQHQLSAQVVVDAVIEEVVELNEEAATEEHQPAH